ncbi:hypothetical protein SEA_POWERPUFF_44 [Arthrobacter phage Powerpuff]|nr:hypothetical protein SEA_POWERPUFF_44 [Arthrobacter phage Powerpuff]QIN94533.1 hypothetical protein SEA_YESCHEF_42 [Arthrobacter phage YesChef]WGH20755.1 hypothetical protein SEA_JOHNDOE_42 [Arthrobacter phage JohnDoe]
MSRSTMGRRPARDADEVDAVSRWGRRYLCYIQRPGVRSAIKRRVRRRERREGRATIRKGTE